MPFDGYPMTEQLVGTHRDQSFSREPYWIVTHHPFMRSDGTRVPARRSCRGFGRNWFCASPVGSG